MHDNRFSLCPRWNKNLKLTLTPEIRGKMDKTYETIFFKK
jgi:hypothetical protein